MEIFLDIKDLVLIFGKAHVLMRKGVLRKQRLRAKEHFKLQLKLAEEEKKGGGGGGGGGGVGGGGGGENGDRPDDEQAPDAPEEEGMSGLVA